MTNWHELTGFQRDLLKTLAGLERHSESVYFSERSKEWWAAVKNYSPRPYPKSYLAKNATPAPFIYYLVRLWLMVYENEQGISEGRVDYTDYDDRMDTKRKGENNRQLEEFR